MKFILRVEREPQDEHEHYATVYLDEPAKKELLSYQKRFAALAEENNALHSMKFWGVGAGLVAFLKDFDPRVELNSDQRGHLENQGWVRVPEEYRMEFGQAYAFPNYFYVDGRFFWWTVIPRGTETTLQTDGASWEMLTCPIHGEDDSLEATCLHCVAMSY